MGTPLHINTTVKGSVGMLQEAAQALRGGERSASESDDAHHQARDTAHSSWEGEGAEAFLQHLAPHLNHTRDFIETCKLYAKAFDDLAGGIEAVNNDMEKILSIAASGGLEVQGPVVLRPEWTGGEPPRGVDYRGDGGEAAFKADRAEYQAKVAAFNAKAETFNRCLGIYTEARKKEEEAHTEFWDAVQAGGGFGVDGAWNIGSTTASKALAAVGGMECARADLLTKLQGLEKGSDLYQRLASGQTSLAGLTAKERMRVMNDLARTKADEVNYRKQIRQLDRLGRRIPQFVKNASTAYPGKKVLRLDQVNPQSALGKRLAHGVFSKVPWAGSLITAFSEVRGAATGEQTWGKAVADTGGILGGGAAGGSAGASLCAPVAPPWGSVVCGVVGAGLGAIGGHEVADVIVPPESDLPQPVEQQSSSPRGTGYHGCGYG